MTLEWFLITSGEIEDMRRRLQAVRQILPQEYRQQINEISGIIEIIENRSA